MKPGPNQAADPLAGRQLFQSRDLDEARAIVAEKFCDHRLDRVSRRDDFDACYHRAEGRTASLNFIRYGADVEIEPGELGTFYLIQIPISGGADIDNGTGEIGTAPGLGSVLNPHRHTRMRWREGCAQLLLQIDAAHLNDVAERLMGRALTSPVTFETAVNEDRTETASWVKRLRTCFTLADKGAVFGAGNLHTQVLVEEQLIEDFLKSQPSDISPLLEADMPAASNLHVRRAVRFIRDHTCDPITIGQIAEAAGVTPRCLQLGFRSALGKSPMQFLRDERMRQARHMLANATDKDRIGDICEKAGFTHFGRFSTEYRKRFGESPRDTLGVMQTAS